MWFLCSYVMIQCNVCDAEFYQPSRSLGVRFCPECGSDEYREKEENTEEFVPRVDDRNSRFIEYR